MAARAVRGAAPVEVWRRPTPAATGNAPAGQAQAGRRLSRMATAAEDEVGRCLLTSSHLLNVSEDGDDEDEEDETARYVLVLW